MRMIVVAFALIFVFCPGSSVMANSDSALVMHHIVTTNGPCDIPDPCPDPAGYAPVGATIAAYLLVRHHDAIAAVQTAFEWGQWTFINGLWDCQANQVCTSMPAPPGGPTAGTITTGFDCLAGPNSSVIGRMHLIVTGPGCISQIQSNFPFSNHVVSCTGDVNEIMSVCWGKICAPTGGIDGCLPCSGSPAEPTTWGDMRRQYGAW